MPPKNSTKGLKMSLGDFMGGAPADELGALPTGPRQRGPDDDGSFQRRTRREDGSDREMSRADQDGSWRKGGGGGFRDDRGGGSGGGFGDRGGFDRGGNRDDRRGGGFDRGGYRGGGNERGNDRGGYDRDGGVERRGGGFDRDSGGGGSRFDRNDRGGFDRGGPREGGFDRGGPREGGFDRGGPREGGFDRGGPREGGFDRGGPRDGGVDRSGPTATGERPRLQLKSRTAPVPASTNEKSPKATSSASDRKTDDKPQQQEVKANIPKEEEPETVVSEVNADVEKTEETKSTDPDKKKREPAVVNSRAALLGDAPDPKRDSNTRRDRGERSDRGPPPVVNKRFADLAEEEREKNKDRESRRGPPPVANSRFASVAEADRREREESGPPPIANSRFAAVAEADRSTYRERNDRGPPPVANSRFAAAAEADRSNDDFRRNDRGPPPTTNSRFAAAAALAEQEREKEGFGRERGGFGRNDDRGGPIPQNSRFAAAAAADQDYVEPSQRNFGGDRGRFEDRDRGDRFNRRGGDDYDRPGRGGMDRNQESEQDSGPAQPEPPKNSVADLLKPKARPLEENILRVPTKEHADNILKPPKKRDVSDALASPKEEKVETSATPAPQNAVEPTPTVDDSAVIAEFSSGKRVGQELKAWVGEQVISSVEKLVFAFLEETQKLTPDVSCAWADPSNYGAALVSLVEDDLLKQVDVLFAVQKYCNKIGMPKLNDEYVIQSMFRSMYKYDLASDDAFEFWKEDESEEHEAGKVNAVIQTVDWFNWLEQDEEEEDDDAEYEE